VSRLVFDAGALIALERNDRALWTALKLAALAGDDVVVPSTVLAQVWRNRPSQALLAKALPHCAIASFDRLARQVGELCARAGTHDICDAHVALVATGAESFLYTSDPKDLSRLIASCRRGSPQIVRC
jgi:hypothetical protein